MTFKTALMSSVAALALAFPAVAQTETDATVEAEVDTGEIAAETDVETSTEVDASEAIADAADDVENAVEETASDVENAVDETVNEIETADMPDMGMENEFAGMTVADLVGLDVHSTNDNDVGEIDYIINANGQYEAVIGIGGFLGLGEYTVALPLDAFSMVEEGKLMLDGYTEAELEAMPEIDESELTALDGEHVIDS